MNNYSKKLKDPRWQKKRLQIFNRDKWACKMCKDTETTLNVHHLEYIDGNDPWDYPNSMLITVCEHCHTEIELNRKQDEETTEIYKSNDWTGGNRIMFALIGDTISMRIYNKNGDYLIGFNMCNDLPELSKLIRKAIKNG